MSWKAITLVPDIGISRYETNLRQEALADSEISGSDGGD
jgi:hypothetical protein